MASKNKGNGFEREICRELSIWWTNNENDDVFWRTSSSGGRATQRAKVGKDTKNHHGDIGCVDACGQSLLDLFVIEVKRGYNRDTFHDLVDKAPTAKEQKYEEWIRKLVDKCSTLGVPYWLLIHKRDRREEMIYLPAECAGNFNYFGVLWGTLARFAVEVGGSKVQVVGHPLKRFLEHVTRADIEGLASAKENAA